MTEDELIQRARGDDSPALAELLQRNYLSVKKYLVTVTLDHALADDLTQETMVRAIQRFRQFTGRSKFSTWLIAIATNLYLDVLRRRSREQRLQAAAVDDLVTTAAEPAEWQDLLTAMHRLPREVVLPIVLKHYYGYAYEDIAAVMGVPVGTVKSRIHNGMATIRKELTGDAG